MHSLKLHAKGGGRGRGSSKGRGMVGGSEGGRERRGRGMVGGRKGEKDEGRVGEKDEGREGEGGGKEMTVLFFPYFPSQVYPVEGVLIFQFVAPLCYLNVGVFRSRLLIECKVDPLSSLSSSQDGCFMKGYSKVRSGCSSALKVLCILESILHSFLSAACVVYVL